MTALATAPIRTAAVEADIAAVAALGLDFEFLVSSYTTTMLWANGPHDEETGEQMDNALEYALAEETLEEIRADVAAFLVANYALIQRANAVRAGYTFDHAMHDFALTRNGHGTGFWDRGLGAVGADLSDAARVYGGSTFYLGDDNLIYL